MVLQIITVTLRSLIADHQNKTIYMITNSNEQVWNIKKISKTWHIDMKWAKAAGKMVPRDVDVGLPQGLNV